MASPGEASAAVSVARATARQPNGEICASLDLEAERQVIASAIIYPRTIASARLAPSDFHSETHRIVWSLLLRMSERGSTIDTVTLGCELQDAGKLKSVGGQEFVQGLTDGIPSERPPFDRVRLSSARRRFLSAAKRLSDAAANGEPLHHVLSVFDDARDRLEGMQADATCSLQIDPAAPLRGLRRLGPIALVGRENILRMAREPISYAWNDIAVTGTIVVIAGPPGEGKTTLLFLLMAARLTRGGPVKLLGRHVAPAPPGKWVVIIEGEHGEASASRKMVKSLQLAVVGDDALDHVIIVARKSVLIGSPEWDEVGQLVAAGLVADIAIDTLARCAPGDANAESEQVSIFDVVAKTIERAPDGDDKPTVWIVAHTRKKNGGPVGIEDVSGSTQRVGQADTVVIVNGTRIDGRMASSNVTFPKLREEPLEYPEPADFSLRTEGGAAVLVQGDEAAIGAPRDDRPLDERIRDLLTSGPRTKNDLKTTLGRSGEHIEAAISQLFAQGAIRTVEKTVRGQPRKAFCLSGEP